MGIISIHTNIKCRCKRCNHEWEAKPYSLLQGHGCPRCAKSGTSFMEQLILNCFVDVLGKEKVKSRDKEAIGLELDIFIPSLKFAIEPGNWNLHKKSIARDREKRARCKENGIRLITVYDKYPKELEPPFSDECIVYHDDLNKSDHSVIHDLIYQLLAECGIRRIFSVQQWNALENKAYKNSKANTHEDFVKHLSSIRQDIEILDKYKNINQRICVRCKNCGFEWNAVPANLLAGDGCRKCGTKRAHEKFIRNQNDFEEELKRINPTVKILGKYQGRHKPIKTQCLICGCVWYPTASSLLRGSTHKGAVGIHKKIKKQ